MQQQLQQLPYSDEAANADDIDAALASAPDEDGAEGEVDEMDEGEMGEMDSGAEVRRKQQAGLSALLLR